MQTPILTNSKTSLPSDILDVKNTLKKMCDGNQDMLKEMLKILWEAMPNDLLELERLRASNNIEMTRKLLHQLDGRFRYCIVPRLQRARTALHEAVKQTSNLTELEPLYKNFFMEMDYYMQLYEKLKKEGTI